MSKLVFNQKEFLLPDSPRSMACYHAKIMEDKIFERRSCSCCYFLVLVLNHENN